MQTDRCEAFIAGAAIVDAAFGPVDAGIFERNSTNVPLVRLGTGGCALNVCAALSSLSHKAALSTCLGADDAAEIVRNRMRVIGALDAARVHPEFATGVNAVLVRPDGERHFITNPSGSLRMLTIEDVLAGCALSGYRDSRIACLAGAFVSPRLTCAEMEALFERWERDGKIVAADMTTPKNGETAEDFAKALSHVDVYFANAREIALLTGCASPEAAARALRACGVGRVVVKLGASGSLTADADGLHTCPAYPLSGEIDTTGAGDAFVGGYLSGLLENLPEAECAALANSAAACVVERFGADVLPDPKCVRKRASALLCSRSA